MARSDYKQVIFCCNLFDIDSLENHSDKHIPFAIADNVFINVKDFIMIINGAEIDPAEMSFFINGTVVYLNDRHFFWINKNKLGFGCLLFANDRFVDKFDFIGARHKIINLVNKYFDNQYNIIVGDKLNDIFFCSRKVLDEDSLKKNIELIESKQNTNTKNTMAMHEFVFTAINKAFKMV